MVQLLQDLADEFANFAQGMVRGNPLLRMNVRKHPALILRPSAHLQSSRRIRGELNHHSFALARFFSKLLAGYGHAQGSSIAVYEDHVPHIEWHAWAGYGEHFRSLTLNDDHADRTLRAVTARG